MSATTKAGMAFLVAAAIVFLVYRRCASCQERWRALWQGR